MSYVFLVAGAPLIEGEASGDQFGAALAGGEDIDGDGVADLVVGAPGHDSGGTDAGALYVFYGTGAGIEDTWDARIDGDTASGALGGVLCFLPDVQGDGYADLAAGLPDLDQARVYSGSATGLGTSATTLSGTTGADFGFALASGDLDGDTLSDLLVGAPSANEASAFLGASTGLSTSAFATLEGENTGDEFGYAVAAVPDIDGDGDDEWAVGAPGYDWSWNTGAAFLFLGDPDVVDETAAWQSPDDPVNNVSREGATVFGGDYDGDGDGDLVVVGDRFGWYTALLFASDAGVLPASDTAGFADHDPPWSDITSAGYWHLGPLGAGPADAVGASLDSEYTSSECTCSERLRTSAFAALPSRTVVELRSGPVRAMAGLGDSDANGLADLAVALDTDPGSVSIRLAATDADGDGFHADVGKLLLDCDDADAARYPVARETDGDGVDSNCDGDDDRPSPTHATTCPSIAEASDLAPYRDSECGFDPCPTVLAEEVWDATVALGCVADESADIDDGDCSTYETELASCEGTAEGRSVFEAHKEYEPDPCTASSWSGRSTVLVAQFETPTASGLIDARVSGSEDASAYGTVGWADGTRSTFDAKVSDDSSVTMDGCTYSRSFEESDMWAGGATWRFDTGAGEFTITNILECGIRGLGGALVVTHEASVSFIDEATWTVLTGDDLDGDGWLGAHGDCDDTNATIYPCATENGTDTVDEDCDGWAEYDGDADGVDDAQDCDPLDPSVGKGETWYPDADGDGFGDESAEGEVDCAEPDGVVADNTDCDDSTTSVNPGAAELCDTLDNDCNGDVDDQAADAPDWYYDRDGDGYGGSESVDADYACEGKSGWTTSTGDCNDDNPRVYPGAREYLGDGNDQDCSGSDELGAAAPAAEEACGCDQGAATTPFLSLLAALAWRRRRPPALHPRA